MTTEREIVEKLAACDEPFVDRSPDYCMLCRAELETFGALSAHKPDCPWRMAREFVQQPAVEPDELFRARVIHAMEIALGVEAIDITEPVHIAGPHMLDRIGARYGIKRWGS